MMVYLVIDEVPYEGFDIKAVYLDKEMAERAARITGNAVEEHEIEDTLPYQRTEFTKRIWNIDAMSHPDFLDEPFEEESTHWVWPFDKVDDDLHVMAGENNLTVTGYNQREVREAFDLKLHEMLEALPETRKKHAEEKAERNRILTEEGPS